MDKRNFIVPLADAAPTRINSGVQFTFLHVILIHLYMCNTMYLQKLSFILILVQNRSP